MEKSWKRQRIPSVLESGNPDCETVFTICYRLYLWVIKLFLLRRLRVIDGFIENISFI